MLLINHFFKVNYNMKRKIFYSETFLLWIILKTNIGSSQKNYIFLQY